MLPVVLFHAHAEYFSGGFVGVDIFFVISGYLITSIIAAEVTTGRFSLARFYERRIRRIFPALFTMIAASTVAGFIILVPADFESFGSSVLSATVFGANIFYWQQSGYFDGPAELKMLLHLWSLAVEEQFYLFFPIGLMIFWRWFRGRWAIPVIGATILSFFLGLWAMERDPSAAFYLAPFRAWELLIGSVLALGAIPPARSQLVRNLLSVLGLCLILYAVFALSEMSTFPGANALFPCIGTALIIHAGERGPSLVGRLLSLRPLVFVGLISYSVYLWHWPLFAFARYYAIGELGAAHSVALVVLSFLIGAASWLFVEAPFRRKSEGRKQRPVFAVAAFVMVCAVISGASIIGGKGWPERFNPQVSSLSAYAASTSPLIDMCSKPDQFRSSRCLIGSPGGTKLFLWGDSHAGALYGTFRQLGREGFSTVFAATPRCPPLIGVGTSPECIKANWEKLRFLQARKDIQTVILSARWSVYFRGRSVGLGPAETNANVPYLQDEDGGGPPPLAEGQRLMLEHGARAAVIELLRMNKNIVIVYPVPGTGYDIPSTLARLASQDVDPASFTRAEALYLKRQADTFKILDSAGNDPRIVRIYPHKSLCSRGRCGVYANGHALYSDSNHLSIPGAELLLPQFRAALR